MIALMSFGQTQPQPNARSDAGELWRAVDRLVDRAPRFSDLISHKLELFAARRWRALGRSIPAEFLERERRASVGALALPLLLDQVFAAYDGGLIPMKGAAVAGQYPEPGLRSFGDVDLLAADAPTAQASLLAAGFQEVGNPADFIDIQHLRPLCWPGLPLGIEIHSRPKWPDGIEPPPATAELFDAAAPAGGGRTILPPAHHALLIAAHSWAHEPLRRLRDLVDVAVMTEAAGRAEVAALAREWRIERLWRSTLEAADSVLYEAGRPWALRLWARNLENARERTVLENHLQRWLGDFWIMPLRPSVARMPTTIVREFLPKDSEGWGAKLSRSTQAVRNAARPRSEHEDQLDQRWRR